MAVRRPRPTARSIADRQAARCSEDFERHRVGGRGERHQRRASLGRLRETAARRPDKRHHHYERRIANR